MEAGPCSTAGWEPPQLGSGQAAAALGLTKLSLQAPSSTALPSLSLWPSSLTSSTTSTFACRRSWRKGRTRCRRSAAMAQVGVVVLLPTFLPLGVPLVSIGAHYVQNKTMEPFPLQRVSL